MRPRSWRGRSKPGSDAGSLDTGRYRGDRGRRMAPLTPRQGPGGHRWAGHQGRFSTHPPYPRSPMPDDLLPRLAAEPLRAAIILDVDGTLAPIVARPEDA